MNIWFLGKNSIESSFRFFIGTTPIKPFLHNALQKVRSVAGRGPE
jgi:hypothetical protein